MAIWASDNGVQPALGFSHEKAIQEIAYLIGKAGQPLEKLKLVKLIYLADRLSLKERGKPLNFDEYYSMPHGPVASSVLNGMNGKLDQTRWSALQLASDNRHVSVVSNPGDDQLSRADKRILDTIWQSFGHMTAWQLRTWTHEHCSEYVEVEEGRLSIDLADILEAVGQDRPIEYARDVRQLQREMGILERMRAA